MFMFTFRTLTFQSNAGALIGQQINFCVCVTSRKPVKLVWFIQNPGWSVHQRKSRPLAEVSFLFSLGERQNGNLCSLGIREAAFSIFDVYMIERKTTFSTFSRRVIKLTINVKTLRISLACRHLIMTAGVVASRQKKTTTESLTEHLEQGLAETL